EGVGAAVDADEHGLEVADVRLDDVQVALHPGAAGHHEGVPVAKARLHLREPDPFGKELRLVTKVPEGVLGEALERLGDAASLLGQLRLDVRLRQGAAGREARAVAEEARAADDEGLAVPDLLEEVGVAVHVDEPDPAAHKLERPGVREAPAHRGRDVDDDAYVRGEKLLRGHAVEVAVVDDRDVVRPEAPDEALRPLVEPRVTRELPEAHCWTASMNSAPPSILSTSSLLADSAKRSMRVWVGSPGTFSTRKWVSAALAIWGRWVIVSTCARSASLPRASATACAVRPPMPASISSKTIVGSPAPAWATARRASATRESSPPEAVSATGANGRPEFGRMRKATASRPVEPCSRSETSAWNSPSPIPSPCSSAATDSPNDAPAAFRASDNLSASSVVLRSASASASSAAASGSTPASCASSSARAASARVRSSS